MGFFELFALMPEWAVFTAVMVFVFGCCMGSFVNCLAWRTVHGESILRGRSHCATCGHRLSALDEVPILSWLFLHGKCRYCGEPVSFRYPATELLCGAFFVSVLLAFGLEVRTPFLMALGCVLLGLSLVDLDSMVIPNKFVLAGILIWVAMLVCSYAVGSGGVGADFVLDAMADGGGAFDPVVGGLLSAVVVSGLVLLVSCAFKALTGKAGMGMGDVKLYFMVSLYLGFAAGVLNLFVSCLVGLAFAVVFAGREQSGSGDEVIAEVLPGADEPVVASDGVLAHGVVNELVGVDGAPDAGVTSVAAGGSNVAEVESSSAPLGKPFPFGPSIALATWFSLLFGPSLVTAYLGLF